MATVMANLGFVLHLASYIVSSESIRTLVLTYAGVSFLFSSVFSGNFIYIASSVMAVAQRMSCLLRV